VFEGPRLACRHRLAPLRAAAAFGLALALAAPAPAQEPVAPAAAAELEAQAAEQRAAAEEWKARTREFDAALTGAPERLRAIDAELARLDRPAPVSPRADRSELEAQLVVAEQDLAAARRESVDLDIESAHRAERRRRIPELVAAAKERLRALDAEPPPAAEEAALAGARVRLGQARRAALEAEIAAYEREVASYDARGQLLARRIELAERRTEALEVQVEALLRALSERRQAEAARAAERARRLVEATAALDPEVQAVVRELAEQNARLAEQRAGPDGLLVRIEETTQKLARAETSVARVEADLSRLMSKVKAAGLTDSVGALLRKQRADAPEVGKYQRFIRMRQSEIDEVQLRQIELREERETLAKLEEAVEATLADLAPEVGERDRARIEALLRDLLETRLVYLDALIQDYETYFQKLVDFDARQQELVERTRELVDFIDARILWMPSAGPVGPGVLADARGALAWLFAPEHRAQLGRAARDALVSAPVRNGLVALLLVLSLPLGRRVRRRLHALGEAARSPWCDRFAPTAEAVLLTALLSPWLAGALLWVGWRIGVSAEATQFARCIAGGLVAAGVVWLTVALPRQVLRPAGLAEAHFGWPAPGVAVLRRELTWFLAMIAPAVFAIFVFEASGEEAWIESIGRAALVFALGAAAAFTHRVVRVRGGALVEIARAAGAAGVPGWAWRLLHVAAVAVPVLLAAAALLGYRWTALALATRWHFALFFLFSLGLGWLLSARWSLVARRGVALERARRQREAAAQLDPHEAAEERPGSGEPDLDLAAVDAQTSRLLTGAALFAAILGLWAIWADVLPAVGILREVGLWTTTEQVAVEVTDAAGTVQTRLEPHVVPITLADLALAVLIAVMTLVVVRNLPGLLAIVPLARFGVGAGERYAFATLAKYALTLAGLALALSTVGVAWSNLQWLIAAVGIGLGFGLQEIFANFVSGLIVLFERPIRVGDTVTIGDLSGTVSRIRIRATWITGFDRKELIVPNKEFVTGKLINWSLSDSVLRVDVRVGIVYGSDTERAVAVLQAVAAANPHALRDPPPQVVFMGFGASSLDFELRVFSPDVAHLMTIRHELNMAIDREFQQAGIEMAFPVLDVRVAPLPTSGGNVR
jgi:potassium efflux system protein